MTGKRDGGMTLTGPVNVVRQFSARMGTTESGIRIMLLEVRFDVVPEDDSTEIALVLDSELASMLAARLTELSEAEDQPKVHH